MTTISSGVQFGGGVILGPATVSELYAFSSFTFTNANSEGRVGPTLSNCTSTYDTVSNPWLTNTDYFNMLTRGYQLWTVPKTGTYKIRVAGASAGGRLSNGTAKLSYTVGFCNGAVIESANVSLTKGQKLQILVGQQGIMYANVSSGGGGGTFVVNYTGNTNTLGDAIMVAGGGSGAHIYTSGGNITYAGSNGNVSSPLGNRNSSSTANGGNLTVVGNTYPYMGGRTGGWTGGGGGLLADGAAATNGIGAAKRGNAFINGGVGGSADTAVSSAGTAWGGFGGGGGSHGNSGGGGGAGGYCGGGGGDQSNNLATGGGGGSYSIMPGYTQVGTNRGHGYCTITFMGS